jgi:hypothetical protein
MANGRAVASQPHECLPLGAVRLDAFSIEPVRSYVGRLVTEDLAEHGLRRFAKQCVKEYTASLGLRSAERRAKPRTEADR